jgi:anti-sigma regulatory factor (Ser/Thr protein kinase)
MAVLTYGDRWLGCVLSMASLGGRGVQYDSLAGLVMAVGRARSVRGSMNQEYHLPLDAVVGAAGQAREFVRESMVGPYNGQVERAVLCVSEMVTNAVLHGVAPIVLSLEHADSLFTISVTDTSSALPVAQQPDLLDQSGRGVSIIEWLSDSWGVEQFESGKRVWCQFVVPPSENVSV